MTYFALLLFVFSPHCCSVFSVLERIQSITLPLRYALAVLTYCTYCMYWVYNVLLVY